MKNTQSCLSRETLDEIGQNDMAPEQLSSIEEHVSDCEHCREMFDAAYATSQWQQDIRPALLESPEPIGSYVDDDFTDQVAILKLLGPTDDPHMLGRIGSYEVVGLIGRGGMGVVFKAFDSALDRFVAIKMLSPHLAASGAARKRFLREGKAAAAVVDDHVLPVYGVDEWQGIPYLVMQYSRGISLQQRLNHQGPLELKEILRIGLQVARGLAAAHAQGLVHRDVKPSNILLNDSVERAMLMDFGLARAVDDATMTRSGVVAGTPQYMSPEQARAESIDQRSDLFSLGSVMYAMCAGRAPFRAGTSLGVLRLISDNHPRPIQEINSDIPVWLGRLISNLMSKEPEQRPESACEVAELLETCLAHVQQPKSVPLPASLMTRATTADSIGRPRMLKYLASAAAAIGLMLAGVLIVLELNKGTIRIDCDADDIPIRIMQGDEIVQRLTVTREGQSVRVAAGKYVVVIDGKIDGITVKDGVVSLQRGKTAPVRITRSSGASDVSAPPLSPNVADATAHSKASVRDKVTVDIYGGADVLSQMNGRGPNKARHVRFLQELNAIKDVVTNFREAGPGNKIFTVIVRDPSNLFRREVDLTGLLSTTRFAIKTAVENAGIESIRWEDTEPTNETATTTGESIGPASGEFAPVKITVIGEDGQPMKGATVNVLMAGSTDRPVEVDGTTGANGIAIDQRLPYGKYRVGVSTPDGWYLSSNSERIVQFGKGLSFTVVAPSPAKKCTTVLESQPVKADDSVRKLLFGNLQPYFRSFTPEPGEPAGEFRSFPTLETGIMETALTFQLKLTRDVPQTDGKSSIEWTWSPDHSRLPLQYMLSKRGLQRIKTYRDLASQLHNETRIGYREFDLEQPVIMPYRLTHPPGMLTVYILNAYGRPDPQVQASLDIRSTAMTPSGVTESWLPLYLRKNSEWISKLINTDDWSPGKLRKPTYIQHLMRREIVVEAHQRSSVRIPAVHDLVPSDEEKSDAGER